MSVLRAISLNNRAVTMLNHGEHKEALNTFRLALESFCQELDDAARQMERTGLDLLPNQGGKQLMAAEAQAETETEEEFCVRVKSVEIKAQLKQADAADDDHLFFFNRALVLSNSAAKHGDVTPVSILYNLALVGHLSGLRTRCEARFRMALRFYGMAYEIIQNHHDQGIFDDVLIMALVNNLGHVQRRLGHLDEARKQAEFLRSVVGLGPSPPSGSNYCPQVNESDYAFFYLNALEIRVSAPAA
jgi:tetratricopeptide (TPR) repeat protein